MYVCFDWLSKRNCAWWISNNGNNMWWKKTPKITSVGQRRCLGACCRFCKTHHQPQHWACTCSLGAAPGSRRYSGAILWTSALTVSLRFSSSLWLSGTQCCIDLGQHAGWNSFSQFLEIPRSALPSDYFSLKGFQSPGQPISCHYFQTLSSWPIMSWQPSSFFIYPCTYVFMKIGVYIGNYWYFLYFTTGNPSFIL